MKKEDKVYENKEEEKKGPLVRKEPPRRKSHIKREVKLNGK